MKITIHVPGSLSVAQLAFIETMLIAKNQGCKVTFNLHEMLFEVERV